MAWWEEDEERWDGVLALLVSLCMIVCGAVSGGVWIGTFIHRSHRHVPPAVAAPHTGATSEVGPPSASSSVLVQRKTRPSSPAPHARSRRGWVVSVVVGGV